MCARLAVMSCVRARLPVMSCLRVRARLPVMSCLRERARLPVTSCDSAYNWCPSCASVNSLFVFLFCLC